MFLFAKSARFALSFFIALSIPVFSKASVMPTSGFTVSVYSLANRQNVGPAYQALLLTNHSASTLQFTQIELAGESAGKIHRLSLKDAVLVSAYPDCAASLSSGAACLVLLKAEPGAVGQVTDHLKITASTGESTYQQSLALTATTYLYAGGNFTHSGDTALNCIAKWDGNNWSALGSGIDDCGVLGAVDTLAVDANGNLYAGGSFAEAGGQIVNHVGKWDGQNWWALGGATSGTNDDVTALSFNADQHLLVGGDFNKAGGKSLGRLALWDGASWSAVGGGVRLNKGPASLAALVSEGQAIIAGGLFTEAGKALVDALAKWDGQTWSALGNGLTYAIDVPEVLTMALDQNNLYVGGWFSTAGGVTAVNVALWDGTNWSSLGGATDQPNNGVLSLAIAHPGVYVGGAFTAIGNLSANAVAKWDGQTWSALGSGLGKKLGLAEALALTVDAGGNLYVGGQFDSAGGHAFSNIALWNGNNWYPLSAGLDNGGNGDVASLALGSVLTIH